MEVNNNPMMDQLLVNTAAQAPAAPNARPAQDAEKPDFDSMVHQKRSAGEKAEAKEQKPAKADAKKDVKGDAPQEQEPVTDEQYAIAAAMMFQAQPDARYTAIQAETAAAAPEHAVETVQAVDAEASVELPETPVGTEVPAEQIAEAVPETAETTVETTEVPQRRQADAVPAETRQQPAEARREAVETPEARPEQRAQQAETRDTAAEPVRAEQRIEAVRPVRSENTGSETEDEADAAQLAQETPLFENIEAPVIKVAEATRPIPLEAENGVEQLGNEIDNIVVNSVDTNRIEITLTPENLGKLTVEITRGTDGTLNIVLHATTECAANLLEKGADSLRQALAANSGREAQIEVRGSSETQQQFHNPYGRNDQERQQQQQQQNRRRTEQHSAQDFLQQLRLGLVDVDETNE